MLKATREGPQDAAEAQSGGSRDTKDLEDRQAARDKTQAVADKLEAMRLGQAATIVRQGVDETLSYMDFPREHWTRIRTNNVLERIMREIRRRTRVVGNFPDGRSAVMLVAARLRHIAGTRWGKRAYLDMDRLREAADAVDRFESSAKQMGKSNGTQCIS